MIVRQRGNQVAIVHGERRPGDRKVQQRILFLFFSQAEAREAIGQGADRFRRLMEGQYPLITFRGPRAASASLRDEAALFRSQRRRASIRIDRIAPF